LFKYLSNSPVMKNVFVIVFAFIASGSFAQSHSKGTISGQVGADFGVHGTISEAYYQNTLTDRDTSAAVTSLFRIDVNTNILKYLSLGVK
jgi:hypothetical protein